ncbi:MAG: hypothetical protein NZ942_03260 [Candidatus Aenigmarchaeota archaeon]|nr:hypothetical protein [Candidatus Aenigmarchaeota archaeon]
MSRHTKSYELTWQNASEKISCLLYKERGKLSSLEIKFNDAIAKERYTVRLVEDTKLILGKEFNETKELRLIDLKLPVELFQMYLKQYLGISSLEELEKRIKSGKELKEFLKSAHLPARSLIENLGFKGAKKNRRRFKQAIMEYIPN